MDVPVAQQNYINMYEMSSRRQKRGAYTLDSCIGFDRGRYNLGSHNWATTGILHLDSTTKSNASYSCYDFLHTLLQFSNVLAALLVWLDNGIHSESLI